MNAIPGKGRRSVHEELSTLSPDACVKPGIGSSTPCTLHYA